MVLFAVPNLNFVWIHSFLSNSQPSVPLTSIIVQNRFKCLHNEPHNSTWQQTPFDIFAQCSHLGVAKGFMSLYQPWVLQGQWPKIAQPQRKRSIKGRKEQPLKAPKKYGMKATSCTKVKS